MGQEVEPSGSTSWAGGHRLEDGTQGRVAGEPPIDPAIAFQECAALLAQIGITGQRVVLEGPHIAAGEETGMPPDSLHDELNAAVAYDRFQNAEAANGATRRGEDAVEKMDEAIGQPVQRP